MAPALRLTPLDPARFGRAPWKNGGGVTIDIASEQHGDAGGWDGVVWRLGRTAIVASAPFSDLSGFDRCQVVVAGSGLVLETPGGEIDLREPFRPVSYDGGLVIRSRLEAGPVEVVNLIADRSRKAIALAAPDPGQSFILPAGSHVLYAAAEAAGATPGSQSIALPAGHALRIDAAEAFSLVAGTGRLLVASILPRRG